MITLLTTGVSNTIAQSTVYALPAMGVFLHSTVALELTVDGTNYVLDVFTTTGIQTSALAVRCTTGNAICVIKRF
jgi:hypothetical protein